MRWEQKLYFSACFCIPQRNFAFARKTFVMETIWELEHLRSLTKMLLFPEKLCNHAKHLRFPIETAFSCKACVLFSKRIAFPKETLHFLAKHLCSHKKLCLFSRNIAFSHKRIASFNKRCTQIICFLSQNICVPPRNVVFSHETFAFSRKTFVFLSKTLNFLENFCILSQKYCNVNTTLFNFKLFVQMAHFEKLGSYLIETCLDILAQFT